MRQFQTGQIMKKMKEEHNHEGMVFIQREIYGRH